MSIKQSSNTSYVVFALESKGLDGTCVYSDDPDESTLETLLKDTTSLGSVISDNTLTHYLAYKYPAHVARLPDMKAISALGYLPKSIVASAQNWLDFIMDAGNAAIITNTEDGSRTLSQDPTMQNVASICRKLIVLFPIFDATIVKNLGER